MGLEMVSVRVPEEMETKIVHYSEVLNITRSELVKRALYNYLDVLEHSVSSYDLGKDLFGIADSGVTDLGSNRKKYLKDYYKSRNEKRNSH